MQMTYTTFAISNQIHDGILNLKGTWAFKVMWEMQQEDYWRKTILPDTGL